MDIGHRLVVFGETRTRACHVLLSALLDALAARPHFRLLGVVESARRPVAPAWRRGLVDAARRFFDTEQLLACHGPRPAEPEKLLRRAGVPLIRPPRCDINHPDLRRLLIDTWRPTGALAIGCLQIFRPELLRACHRVVNLHNSLLPRYGGLRATSWAVYHGEAQTGFTFHEMTPDIDAGPILLQESLPIGPDARVALLDQAILEQAGRRFPELLDRLDRGEPGRPQAGEATYFGARELRAIRRIDAVADFTLAELRRRLRAFKWLHLQVRGRWWEVTHLETVPAGTWGAARTADGYWIRPHRFMCLPAPLYALYRLMRRAEVQ